MNKSKQYKNLESKNIEVYESKHLPLVKEFAERIGLVETINKLVPSEMDIDPGTMGRISKKGAKFFLHLIIGKALIINF